MPKSFDLDAEEYDVVVIGSGLAGTVASTYITDNKKKVLML